MDYHDMIPRGVVRFDFANGIVTVPQSDPIRVQLAPRKQGDPPKPRRSVNNGPELWAEAHTKQDPTKEWFDGWIARVPRSCGCDKFLATYLVENPPDFANWPRWIWALHNAVNRKLGKQEITFEAAQEIWHRGS